MESVLDRFPVIVRRGHDYEWLSMYWARPIKREFRREQIATTMIVHNAIRDHLHD